MEKETIISIARDLFYNEGPDNVTIKTIAEKCGVATSLINYHFKSKDNLIVKVLEDYCVELENQVKDALYECRVPYDLLVDDFLSLRIKLDLYEKDEKARKFYMYYLNCGMDTLFSADYTQVYTQIDRSLILSLSNEYNQLPSVSAAAHGMILALIYAFFTERLDCSYEQFVDYIFETRFKLLNIPKDVSDKTIEEIKTIYEMYDYTIAPNFKVKFKRKG